MVLSNAQNYILEMKSVIMYLIYPVYCCSLQTFTLMTLRVMQTLKNQISFKGMSIENCLVRPNFGATHKMKNYSNVLKMGNIDGAT